MKSASYNPEFFDALATAEARHFWFVHRNRVIAGMLRQAGGAPPRRVLEIGCGTGNVLRVLTAGCPGALVVGLEFFAEGLLVAKSRSAAALVRARVEALPFREPFDVVGMFDVLEHIADDTAALAAVRRQIAADGRLLLTVPAHQWLWSEFDVASGHVRRYSPKTLEGALKAGGFRVVSLTQFMAPLTPLVWASRRLRRGHGTDTVGRELHVSNLVNAMLLSVLGLEEKWLAAGKRLVVGTSIAAIAAPE